MFKNNDNRPRKALKIRIHPDNKQVRVDMDDQDFVLIFNKNDGDKVDVVKVD